MSPLRTRFLEDMQLHGYSTKTQSCYVGAVRALAKHYGKSPDLITEEELRRYFLHLTLEKKVARGSGLKMRFYGTPDDSGRQFHFAHGACARCREFDSLGLRGGHSVFHDVAQAFESLDRSCAVADAARRKKVRAIADVSPVGFAPLDKGQVTVRGFHD